MNAKGKWRLGVLIVLLASGGCSAPAPAKNELVVEKESKTKKPASEGEDPGSDPVADPPGETPIEPESPASACNAAAAPTSSVSSDYDPTFPTPLGAGGTVSDGTYTLTGWSKFQGHAVPTVEQRRQTIVVSGNGTIAEVVTQTNGGALDRTSWTIAKNGMTSRLVFTMTCPAGTSTALSFSYRAINNDLTLYDTDKSEGSDFVK
jgi:hypothetical protein